MKEIKFRGKRIDNGEWVYGSLNLFIGKAFIQIMAWLRADGNCSIDTIQVDPATVAQFTGLKDKFGAEVYENHIVKQTYHFQTGSVHDGTDEDFSGHHIGKVVITTSKGVCMKNPLNYSDEAEEVTVSKQYKNVSGRRCEVIGDIHSNPELLEVKP